MATQEGTRVSLTRAAVRRTLRSPGLFGVVATVTAVTLVAMTFQFVQPAQAAAAGTTTAAATRSAVKTRSAVENGPITSTVLTTADTAAWCESPQAYTILTEDTPEFCQVQEDGLRQLSETVWHEPFTATQRSLILGWDEPAALAALYVQLLQIAAMTPKTRQPDQKDAYDWAVGLVQGIKLKFAKAAQTEYDDWESNPCGFKPPTGYAWTDGCGTTLLSLLSSPPEPSYDDFVQWGVADVMSGAYADGLAGALQLDTGADLGEIGVAGGGALLAGAAAAGLAIAGAAGAITNASVAAIFPFAAGVASGWAGAAGAVTGTVLGAFAASVAVVILAVVAVVVEIIRLTTDAKIPGQLATNIKSASDPITLGTYLDASTTNAQTMLTALADAADTTTVPPTTPTPPSAPPTTGDGFQVAGTTRTFTHVLTYLAAGGTGGYDEAWMVNSAAGTPTGWWVVKAPDGTVTYTHSLVFVDWAGQDEKADYDPATGEFTVTSIADPPTGTSCTAPDCTTTTSLSFMGQASGSTASSSKTAIVAKGNLTFSSLPDIASQYTVGFTYDAGKVVPAITATATATATPADPFTTSTLTYKWTVANGGANATYDSQTFTYDFLAPGTYTITVTATATAGEKVSHTWHVEATGTLPGVETTPTGDGVELLQCSTTIANVGGLSLTQLLSPTFTTSSSECGTHSWSEGPTPSDDAGFACVIDQTSAGVTYAYHFAYQGMEGLSATEYVGPTGLRINSVNDIPAAQTVTSSTGYGCFARDGASVNGGTVPVTVAAVSTTPHSVRVRTTTEICVTTDGVTSCGSSTRYLPTDFVTEVKYLTPVRTYTPACPTTVDGESFTLATGDVLTVSVCISSSFLGTGTTPFGLDVQDVPPGIPSAKVTSGTTSAGEGTPDEVYVTPGSSLTASFSADGDGPAPLSFDITWGDGTTQQVTGTSTQTLETGAYETTVTVSHTYTTQQDGPFSVTATAVDADDATSGTPTAVIDLQGVFPSPVQLSSPTYSESSDGLVTLTVPYSDPSGTVTKATITWGDSTTTTTTVPLPQALLTGTDDTTGFTATHPYDTGGTYTATVTIDNATEVSQATERVSITTTTPVPMLAADPPTVTGGRAVQMVAAVLDDQRAAALDLSVDWGDGTTTTLTNVINGAKQTLAHTYTASGDYTVTLEASGPGGEATPLTTSVDVPAQPPTVLTPSPPAPPHPPDGSKTARGATSSTPGGKAGVTDTGLSATAHGEGALTVAKYTRNPTPKTPVGATGTYVDVAVATGSAFSSLTITLCSLSTGDGLDWWNGTSWLPFSDESSVQTGCITATVTTTTSPTIAELTGTPIAVVKRRLSTMRIAGQTADATAVEELETEFPATGKSGSCPGAKPDSANTRPVVLATTKTFSDALSASYLAASLDTGVLLTPTTQLSQVTAEALETEGVTKVVIVGGTLAISSTVAEAIASTPAYACGGASALGQDITVTRIGGTTAYDTAEMIAETPAKATVGSTAFTGAYAGVNATGGDGAYNDTAGTASATPSSSKALRTAVLAAGTEYQDAMSSSAMAYAMKFPVLLTTPTSLSSEAATAISALTIAQVIVMGGPLAVSNTVVAALEKLGVSVLRVGGKDATDTAAELATFEVAGTGAGLGWAGTQRVAVTRGNGFTDGLAGSIVTGRTKLPLLLTEDPTMVGSYLTAFLKASGQSGAGIDAKVTSKVSALVVLGGPDAITTAVVTQMESDIT